MKGRVGTYLEIGASHPIYISNTYALEKQGWSGLSIDIDPMNRDEWYKVRTNPLLITDATDFEFKSAYFDYLSLDCEPPEQTYKALMNILMQGMQFNIITYETDAYADDTFVQPSRLMLKNFGYELVFADVQCPFGAFEDWYINPNIIDLEHAKKFK